MDRRLGLTGLVLATAIAGAGCATIPRHPVPPRKAIVTSYVKGSHDIIIQVVEGYGNAYCEETFLGNRIKCTFPIEYLNSPDLKDMTMPEAKQVCLVNLHGARRATYHDLDACTIELYSLKQKGFIPPPKQ
ncbi:hypothetical protein JW711_02030 [Candidatus Woesearchaeota archaeon]|nr:hypothetical protein [Candidatus Woesearchaeota archaeon]